MDLRKSSILLRNWNCSSSILLELKISSWKAVIELELWNGTGIFLLSYIYIYIYISYTIPGVLVAGYSLQTPRDRPFFGLMISITGMDHVTKFQFHSSSGKELELIGL